MYHTLDTQKSMKPIFGHPVSKYWLRPCVSHKVQHIQKLRNSKDKKKTGAGILIYVEYQQAVTVYKSLNELNPHYMNKLFSYTQENHSYGTRNATSSLLTLPKCNKSIGQKCISYSGPKVWNGLTEAIRCAPSLPSLYPEKYVLLIRNPIGTAC